MLRKSARWPRYSVVELHHVAIYSEVELAAKLHSIMSMIRIYSEVELNHVAIYSEVELHHVAIYSEAERPLPLIAQGLAGTTMRQQRRRCHDVAP